MITPKQKAIQLVKAFHVYADNLDSYWNNTDDAKEYAKIAINQLCKNNGYYNNVLREIDLLPEYIEHLK